jgi:hypothetical protein
VRLVLTDQKRTVWSALPAGAATWWVFGGEIRAWQGTLLWCMALKRGCMPDVGASAAVFPQIARPMGPLHAEQQASFC